MLRVLGINFCQLNKGQLCIIKSFSCSGFFSAKDVKVNDEIPKNVIEDFHSASSQTENGVIYDKKPFQIRLKPEKIYHWCLCGRSKNQPLCDGTHKSIYLNIKLRPVRFKVSEEKDYWLCNCKQTSHRPFCDGTHKREDIQEKIK